VNQWKDCYAYTRIASSNWKVGMEEMYVGDSVPRYLGVGQERLKLRQPSHNACEYIAEILCRHLKT
jgi:hypothetical protein